MIGVSWTVGGEAAGIAVVGMEYKPGGAEAI